MASGNMKLRTKLLGGFSLPVIAIVIISTVVYNSINSLLEANGWVDHTHKVIAEGELILSSMVNSETGMRGFLIAGKDEYLGPYNEGGKVFDETVAKLKQTVSDNPTQVGRLNEIMELEEQWHNGAAKPQIALRREVAKGEAATKRFDEISARTVGKEKFDALRVALGELDSHFARNNDSAGTALVQTLLLDMVNQETGQRGFLLSGQEASLDPYIQGKKDFSIHAAELSSYLGNSRAKGSLDNAIRLAGEWASEAAQPEIDARREMNKFTATLNDVTALIEEGTGKRAMDAIRVVITTFVEAERKLIEVRTAEAENIASRTILVTILSALLSAVVVGLISFFLTRGVQRQIGAEPEEMAEITQRIAQGDLTQQLKDNGKETGVYAAMIEMVNNLSKIVQEVRESSDSISSGASEISSGNLDLSQRTEEQASSLEETAASMEEMTATVKQNADSARQANQLASSASSQAETGGEVVNRAVGAMSEITASSKKIADIIGVIDEIAFQTNLLALNAAVEAARAGEQGRGFAVVAGEVRNLAQRSSEAAKEIKTLIQDSVGKVEEGSKLVDESGKTLEEIVSGVKKLTDIVSEIAAASSEQAAGIEEVNNAITQMDSMTQQNAALVEEAAAASRMMEEQAQSMNNQVAFFKVTGGAQMTHQAAKPKSSVSQFAQHAHAETTKKKPAPKPAPKQAPKQASKPKPVAKSDAPSDDEWEDF